MRAEGQFISYYQVSFRNLGNRDYIFQRTSDGEWTDARFYEMLPQVKTVARRGAVHNFRPDKNWGEQGELLFASACEPKEFYEMPGGHNDAILNHEDEFSEKIADFLEHRIVSFRRAL